MEKTSDSQKMLYGIGISLALILIGAAMVLFSASQGEVLAGVKLECMGAGFFVVFLSLFSIYNCRLKIPKIIKYFMGGYLVINFLMILFSSRFPIYFREIIFI